MAKVGDISADDRIYACTRCRNPRAFLRGEVIGACDVCFERKRKQEWTPKKELIIRVRNVAAEIAKRKTWLDGFSDVLVSWFGTPAFLFFHIVWFGSWIAINTNSTPIPVFDLNWEHLTMIVSLEAIFLAIFILINQNRAAQVSELRAELDYQVDLKSEQRGAETLALIQSAIKKR